MGTPQKTAPEPPLSEQFLSRCEANYFFGRAELVLLAQNQKPKLKGNNLPSLAGRRVSERLGR